MKQEKKQEKNYWPHAIVGILIFGVFMVSTSITIALKNPIQDENTFFGKKREIDERINDIIKAQQEFNAHFSSHFFIQSLDSEMSESSPALNPESTTEIAFSFPYETKPKRGKAKETIPHLMPNARLLLALSPRAISESKASESNTSESKISDSKVSESAPAQNADIESIKLFLDSTHEANKLQELGSLEPLSNATDSESPKTLAALAQNHALNPQSLLYLSPTLSSLPKGRWKLIVEISYHHSKKAYFEAVFIIPESSPSPSL